MRKRLEVNTVINRARAKYYQRASLFTPHKQTHQNWLRSGTASMWQWFHNSCLTHSRTWTNPDRTYRTPGWGRGRRIAVCTLNTHLDFLWRKFLAVVTQINNLITKYSFLPHTDFLRNPPPLSPLALPTHLLYSQTGKTAWACCADQLLSESDSTINIRHEAWGCN